MSEDAHDSDLPEDLPEVPPSPERVLSNLAKWARDEKNLARLEAWYQAMERRYNTPDPYMAPEPFLKGKVVNPECLYLTQADKEFFRQCGIEIDL